MMKIKQLSTKKKLVHLTNDFATKAQIGFTTSRQLCLFLLLLSQLDPFKEEEEMSGRISIQDIIKFVRKENAKRSGNIYREVLDFVENMMRNNFIKFQSSISFRGKLLPDYIAIFERLKPIEIENSNSVYYEYKFSEEMRPHIKGFQKNFLRLTIPKGIRSGHAVRFLIMAKAHHDRLKAHNPITKMNVEIESLKSILGIEGKYSIFANFKERVLKSILEGVNTSGIIQIVKHRFIKTGRKISHIEFYIQDGCLVKGSKKIEDYTPSTEDIEQLTYAQRMAYNFLCGKNCKKGIVIRQILSKMPSTEYLGWEDVFIEKAWERFEKATHHKRADYKAGAFIKWWQSGEFRNKLFPEIMEMVIEEKKRKTDIQINNRNMAKTMTTEEFRAAMNKLRAIR